MTAINRLVFAIALLTLAACNKSAQSISADEMSMGDPKAKVNESKDNSRNYVLLAELGNKPRTSYLARIRNPHPDLLDKPAKKPAEG